LADEIVHEFDFDIPDVYLLMPILKQALANAIDTTLLYVIYSLISNRFVYLAREKKGPGPEKVQRTHFRTLVGMLLFGIVDAALFSYIQVYLLTDDTDNAKAVKYSNWYRYIHMSYITIYCAVVLEMSACAIFIFEKSRPLTSHVSESEGINGRIILISSRLKSQISQCLVFFIMPFLVIRSLANVAFTAVYVYLASKEQKSTGVTTAALVAIPSVVVYVTLVVIGFEKDWSLKRSVVPGIDADQWGNQLATATDRFENMGRAFLW
jgi:hypothetical protein